MKSFKGYNILYSYILYSSYCKPLIFSLLSDKTLQIW